MIPYGRLRSVVVRWVSHEEVYHLRLTINQIWGVLKLTYDEREIGELWQLRWDGAFEHDARQGQGEENYHAQTDILRDVNHERHERHQTDQKLQRHNFVPVRTTVNHVAILSILS